MMRKKRRRQITNPKLQPPPPSSLYNSPQVYPCALFCLLVVGSKEVAKQKNMFSHTHTHTCHHYLTHEHHHYVSSPSRFCVYRLLLPALFAGFCLHPVTLHLDTRLSLSTLLPCFATLFFFSPRLIRQHNGPFFPFYSPFLLDLFTK